MRGDQKVVGGSISSKVLGTVTRACPTASKRLAAECFRSAPPLNERRPTGLSLVRMILRGSRAFSGLTLRSHGQRIYGRPVCSSVSPPSRFNVSAPGYSAPTCYPPTAREVRCSFTPRSSIRGSGKSARSTFASLLMEQFGGANGELTAALQYFIQAFVLRQKNPKMYETRHQRVFGQAQA